MAIVDDFEQVAALLRGQRSQPPVIEDQKLDTGEALEEAYIPAVSACQCKCVEQAWYAIIEHRSIVTARLVSERAGEPALAGAGFPCDQEVVSPPDPVAGRELGEQRLVETARRLGVEILDGGGLPEVGKLEPRDEPPAFALDGLAIDEEADPLLEHERSNGGLLPLLLERFGHADKTEGDQPIVCGMWKHVSFLCFLFARTFFARRRLRASRGHAIIRELLSGSSHAHGYWRAGSGMRPACSVWRRHDRARSAGST